MSDYWIRKYEEPIETQQKEFRRQAKILQSSSRLDTILSIARRLTDAKADGCEFSVYGYDDLSSLYDLDEHRFINFPHLSVWCKDSESSHGSFKLRVPEGETVIELEFDGPYWSRRNYRYLIPPNYQISDDDLRQWFEWIMSAFSEPWATRKEYLVRQEKQSWYRRLFGH